MPDNHGPWGVRWRAKPSFILTTVAMGLFTDLVLYGILLPALPFIMRNRFNIPSAEIQHYTSAFLATYAGASVFFSVPAGWAASKLGSRQLFLGGLMFLFVATAIFAFSTSLVLLVVSRLLQGISTAVVWTAGLDMVQDTVEPSQVGETIGTIFATISVGELAAPVLGGVLYERGGISAVFAVSAVLLAIDLALRALVIDKKTAVKYESPRLIRFPVERNMSDDHVASAPTVMEAQESVHEGTRLLPQVDDDGDHYKIDRELGSIVRAIPLLYCFREPRLHLAMLLSFVQALFIGTFDATVPTVAESLFHFSSLQVGLVFIALMLPYFALGRLSGQAIDRFGTKAAATSGYAFLVPCLMLLGLPEKNLVPKEANVALFCTILALNGIGLAVVTSPGYVEAIDVTTKYQVANPGHFGENGPYAQLFGFSSLYFFTGLAVGPLLGGFLRANFGNAVMGAVYAAISGVTAIVSFLFVGMRRGVDQG
ncbi:hypothetical protein ED733_001111 [Metarhizium rileyi]|uniref:Major facilitator superfamily (MFS) profile domain-containing protein n=1 Tax=Metarhizium rileyi (strain RCEF 4871) TaxID=1649241 RepID=A0A5C6FZ03_METRR|nr:hypothetical protein ED733_001111 [Metarhizium rileyi]